MRITIAILTILFGMPALAADVSDCDREAAHPSDPDKVVEGRSSGEVVTHRAIPACRESVAQHPDVARFHYQLARAIVYWADANDGDYSEGMEHLETAAEMGYTQALFVVGLMYQREGRICEAVPVMKRAADQGLKSVIVRNQQVMLSKEKQYRTFGGMHPRIDTDKATPMLKSLIALING